MARSTGLRVLFTAAEAEPLIKVGGLGDVAGSLPQAIRKISHAQESNSPEADIRLAIPFHPSINTQCNAPRLIGELPIPTTTGEETARFYSLEVEGMQVYLIGGRPIDQETAIYSPDLEADGYKYVFFSLAILELMKQQEWIPHILHAHDWHTAAAVYALALSRQTHQFFQNTKSILTIHNLPYLGSMTEPALRAFGIPPALDSDLPPWAQYMALPLGLLAADSIVAVSPNYAREILTAEFGSGLDIFLNDHVDKLHGILNGLDTQRWNPETEPKIPAQYSTTDLPKRGVNKASLQKESGLAVDSHTPLLAMVTRMDPQKGVDVAVEALRDLLASLNEDPVSLQVIFLGTGDPVLESAVRGLEQEFPLQVCAKIGYDEPLSHRIYAGADVLLMPSRYEPCGLTQMIAMRYGCVPVATATGGLADTIKDAEGTGEWTGFLCEPAKPAALTHAIRRAVKLYSSNPSAWQAIQLQGMRQDFSWDRSARQYLDHYQQLIGMK